MSKPNYRVVLSFDSGRKTFVARAPELDPCTAEGATRAEAIGRLEEEIDAQLANMLAHGSTPPRSVDEEDFSGELTVKVSKGLHRELAYTARNEGIDVDQLVSELVASAIAERRPKGRSQQPSHDGNRHGGNYGNRGNRGNNMALLDDRANFIEYVRNLDQGQGNGNRGHHGGGPGGGHGQHNRGGRGGRGGRHNNHRGGGGGGGRPGGPQGARPNGGPGGGMGGGGHPQGGGQGGPGGHDGGGHSDDT